MSLADPAQSPPLFARSAARAQPALAGPQGHADHATSGSFYLAVIFLILLFLPLGFNAGSISLTPLRVFLLIIIGPLTVNFLSGKYGPLLWTDLFFVLYLAWVAVTLGVNNPDQAVQNVGSNGLDFIGGYLIGRAAIRSAADFKRLVKWLLGIVLCMLPFAILETQTGVPILLEYIRRIPGVSTHVDVYHPPRLGLLRAQVLSVHPIHYGLFCSTVFTLIIVGFMGEIPKVRRYLLTTLVGIATFLSLSSGAFLAVALQMFLILWAWSFEKVNSRWLILFLVTAFCYVVVDILSNRTPIQVALSYLTLSPHTAYWRTIIFEWGMKNVWDNPLFGIGLNDWERPYYMYSGSMDNFWLVTGVRHGIPGFLFLAGGYLLMLVRVGRRDFSKDPMLSNIRLAWMITFCGLTFVLCTVHVWREVYSYVFFLFGAGSWLLHVVPRGEQDEVLEEVPVEAENTVRYSRFPPSHAPASKATSRVGGRRAPAAPFARRAPAPREG